jgi:hypothetical protein
MATTALLTKKNQKLIFKGPPKVSMLHQVRTILQQKAESWLTDSKILKYQAVLLEKDYLTLIAKNYLNPAEFLIGGRAQDCMEHWCLDSLNTN